MNPGILTPPTQFATMPRGLLGRPTPVLMPRSLSGYDPDAASYLAAVEQADGRPLEQDVRVAIGEFVIGCKEDGIWSAIKSSCILMGARTLSGALTPLAGVAHTNVNFVGSDYNRKTGLQGNGTNKTILTGRAGNADPQDDVHISTFVTGVGINAYVKGGGIVGGSSGVLIITNNRCRVRDGSGSNFLPNAGSFAGGSRSVPGTVVYRLNGATFTGGIASQASAGLEFCVLGSRYGGFFYDVGSGRVAWYSVGTGVNLALLDRRVTTLYNTIGAAIP